MVSSLENLQANERILDAAEKKFLRQGFHRVSMDELAADLGMSKKTLYAHFSGKEALIEAMLARRVARMDEAVGRLFAADIPYCERLGGMARLIHERLSEVSPLFIEDVRRYAPQSFRIVEEYRSRAIPRFFGQLIDEGIASGDIAPALDREMLIRMLMACIQGLVRPDVLGAAGLTPQRAIDEILGIFFRGILTPKGREACGPFFENP